MSSFGSPLGPNAQSANSSNWAWSVRIVGRLSHWRCAISPVRTAARFTVATAFSKLHRGGTGVPYLSTVDCWAWVTDSAGHWSPISWSLAAYVWKSFGLMVDNRIWLSRSFKLPTLMADRWIWARSKRHLQSWNGKPPKSLWESLSLPCMLRSVGWRLIQWEGILLSLLLSEHVLKFHLSSDLDSILSLIYELSRACYVRRPKWAVLFAEIIQSQPQLAHKQELIYTESACISHMSLLIVHGIRELF